MKMRPYSFKEKVPRQRHVMEAKEDDSFHRAVGPIIQTAQLFGILPVSEIFATNVRSVKFRWIRFKVLMAILAILGASLETGLSILRAFKEGFDMHVTAGIIFLGSILIGMHLLLAMARSWPQLIRLWYRTELIFLRKPYFAKRMTLKWRLRVFGFTVLFMALIEHLFYIFSTLFLAHKHIEICNLDVDFLKYFFMSERVHIFDIIPFSYWWIIPLEFLNVSMTFCWSFVDVFIMVISIGLATRFNQINDRMQSARGKIMPESYWIEMRCHYLIMTELLRHMDKKLSVLILLSCANNLFFICYQLFNSFNIKPYVVTTLYFWMALVFIIARTLSMLFCAASVNDASLKPLSILRNVPSKAWTIEVRRFTDFIVHERVALSGRRFFFLTRTLILAMAGTVVTYELVLLDEVDQIKSNADVCE